MSRRRTKHRTTTPDNIVEHANRQVPYRDTKDEAVVKNTVKDSVFCNLFKDKRYILQLYQALHPEDKTTTEADITNVTLENIFLNEMYNDLGFTVGDRRVLLVEAQSTWSLNIIIRSMFYLVQTWKEHIEKTKQDIYGAKKVDVPFPELYVLFTGERKTKPEWIYLSKEFFEGEDSFVEVKVRMLYDGEGNDILHQYVTFTRVYNEQVKKHGRTRRAVRETIRICKDEDVLKEYLKSKESEVVSAMMTLFDREHALEIYVENRAKEAAEKAAKEAAEKAEEKAKDTARKLLTQGISVKIITDALDVDEETIHRWLADTETSVK